MAFNDTKNEKMSKIVSLTSISKQKVVTKAPFRMIGAFWCKFWCNTGYLTIIKKSLDNKSPSPIIDMNKERDYVTVIIPINEYFDEEKLSPAGSPTE